MSMHTIVLPDDGSVLDAFTDASPPIAAGSELYIQNISNNTAYYSDTTDMSSPLVISEVTTATSVYVVEAGDECKLSAENGRVVLTIKV